MTRQSFWRSIVKIISPDAPSRTYVCPYTIRLDAALHCLQGHRIHWSNGGECDGKFLGALCIGNGEAECRFPRLARAEYEVATRLVRWVTTIAFKAGWL